LIYDFIIYNLRLSDKKKSFVIGKTGTLSLFRPKNDFYLVDQFLADGSFSILYFPGVETPGYQNVAPTEL